MTHSHPSSISYTTSSRRCNGSARTATRSRLVFSAVVILASLASTVSGSTTARPPQITAPASLDLPRVPINLDTRIPAPGGRFAAAVPAVEIELVRRADSDDESSSEDNDRRTSSRDEEEDRTTTSEDRRRSTTATDETERSTTLTVPATRSTSSSTSSSSTSTSLLALPSPFDDALPSDFKTSTGDNSCPDFISNLLADNTFRTCYPISMMMETSLSFFNAQKQLPDIVRVLDAACDADVEFCTNYLNEAARNLRKRENCGEEFDSSNNPANTRVMQAYNGLKAYKTMYAATCLQDPDADMYCFATAVTNSSMPSDAYLYYMPYGLALPGASTPSCNQCVTETMAIFHSASADRSQLVVDTYEGAARQINTICGPSFVDAALPPPESSSVLTFSPSALMTLIGVFSTIVINVI